MNYNIGDKFVFEIDRTYASKKHEVSRYGFKGLKNFVLDAKDITTLLKRKCIKEYDPFTEHIKAYNHGYKNEMNDSLKGLKDVEKEKYRDRYTEGLNDAWRLLMDIDETMSDKETDRVFVVEDFYNKLYGIMFYFKPEQAFEIFDNYRKETGKIIPTNAQKMSEIFGNDRAVKICQAYDRDWLDEPYEEPES